MSGRNFAARRARAVGEKSARATLKLEIQSRIRRRIVSGRKSAAIDPSRFGLMMIAWSRGLRGSPPAFASWCNTGSKPVSTPMNSKIWRKNRLRVGAIVLVEEDLELLRREMGLKPSDLLGIAREIAVLKQRLPMVAKALRLGVERRVEAVQRLDHPRPGILVVREGLLDRVPQDRDELGIGQAGTNAFGRFRRVEVESARYRR